MSLNAIIFSRKCEGGGVDFRNGGIRRDSSFSRTDEVNSLRRDPSLHFQDFSTSPQLLQLSSDRPVRGADRGPPSGFHGITGIPPMSQSRSNGGEALLYTVSANFVDVSSPLIR